MSAARVLVIIPAHDEAESLPQTLADLRDAGGGYDVLVVDDGSSDGTNAIARAQGVPVIRHPFNFGVGGALQTGFRFAVDHGYDVGVQFDADGQHDPRFLDALLQPVLDDRCDVSIGSRYVHASGYRAPIFRRLGMRLFSAFVRVVLRQRLTDTTSGFRAYRLSVMERCQREIPGDFPDAPFLIALARRGFRLAEVPVVMRERRAGRSFYTLGKSLYYPYKNLLASFMAWIQRPG
jgi:glycosyltransferase involved in cell wall biosynthesis